MLFLPATGGAVVMVCDEICLDAVRDRLPIEECLRSWLYSSIQAAIRSPSRTASCLRSWVRKGTSRGISLGVPHSWHSSTWS